RLVFKMKYPEILILEYAADRPGDLKYLLNIARPKIGVITAVGDIPAHVEFYSGPESVIREKARLVEQLSALGFAVLNIDDKAVAGLKEYTRAHLMTFGFDRSADVRISNFEIQFDSKPFGISFKIEYKGSFVPIRINGVLGRSQAYSIAAAASVGLIFGLNLVKIAEAFADFKSLPGRMNLIDGIKGSYVIDDSYNASPLSMHAALETLKEIKATRKIAVLGDMLEIGKYSIEAHETIGDLAAGIADILITVGPRAKFIAESAKVAGLSEEKIFIFDKVELAGKKLQDLIKKGDLMLIKASRAMQLDKIVEELKAF
ncbi:MAG: UDP-N-acetylmuramoyl-tripeptide--D-alanyl-D-alanine ligase, partial [Candidatus Brennerbacteria bacterium]|nr:UDP-N-acetylmuramoyl-tripeptide--D-alanyl-D-alanine ligase [Candidatus Brennerbacteria bacterium]